MTYVPFPDIAPPSDMSGGPSDPAITSEPEDGPVISRARKTRSTETFDLSWKALSPRDYDALMTFWKDTVKGSAGICTYTHPVTGRPCDVRLKGLKYKVVKPGRWSVTLTMEEV